MLCWRHFRRKEGQKVSRWLNWWSLSRSSVYWLPYAIPQFVSYRQERIQHKGKAELKSFIRPCQAYFGLQATDTNCEFPKYQIHSLRRPKLKITTSTQSGHGRGYSLPYCRHINLYYSFKRLILPIMKRRKLNFSRKAGLLTPAFFYILQISQSLYNYAE